MKSFKQFVNEGENKQVKGGDPCWSGYQMVGKKMKNGRQVPNCVPANEEVEQMNEGGINDLPSRGMFGTDTKGHYGVYRNSGPGDTKLKIVSKHKTIDSASKQVDKLRKKSGKDDHYYGHLSAHQPEQGKIPKYFHEEVELDEVAAWQRKEGKNPEGGLNRKGIESYRRENPGSKLSMAVTTKPSKLKPGSKAANRRKSFCARMGGMKKRLTSAKTANDPDSRINKSLRKWNC